MPSTSDALPPLQQTGQAPGNPATPLLLPTPPVVNNPPTPGVAAHNRLSMSNWPQTILQHIAYFIAARDHVAGRRWEGASPDLVRFASLSRTTRMASVPYLAKTIKYVGMADWASSGAASAPRGLGKSHLVQAGAAQQALQNLSVVDVGPKGNKSSMPIEAWLKSEEDGEDLLKLLKSRGVRNSLRRVRLEHCRLSRNDAAGVGHALANLANLRSLRLFEVKEHVEIQHVTSTPPVTVSKALESLTSLQLFHPDGIYGCAVHSLLAPHLSGLPALRSLVLAGAIGFTSEYDSLVALLPQLRKLAIVVSVTLPRAIFDEIAAHPTARYELHSLILRLSAYSSFQTDLDIRARLGPTLSVLPQLRDLVLINVGALTPAHFAAIVEGAPYLTDLSLLAGDGNESRAWAESDEALYFDELEKLHLRTFAWDKMPHAVLQLLSRRADDSARLERSVLNAQMGVLNKIGRLFYDSAARQTSLAWAFCIEGTTSYGWKGVKATYAQTGLFSKNIDAKASLDLMDTHYNKWA
ncbi:hypothetical protein JCM9279_005899 [Rhodotorula babjevae]